MKMLLWMAAMAMPVIVAAVDTLPIHNELVYTTTTACDRITKELPQQHELAGLLLPNKQFDGEIALTKQVAKVEDPTKCMLRLQIKGVLEQGASGVENVFKLASRMDQQLTELVETQYLRGSEGRLQDLKLQSIHVVVSKREYVINLEPRDSPQSQLTMSHGDTCSTLSIKDMLHEILPNGLVNLEAIKTEQVVLNQGSSTAQCAVGLNLVTHVAPFGSNEDAFALLKTVDDRLKDYFGLDASVEDSKGPLLSSVTMQIVANASTPSASLLVTNFRAQSMNPPTKAIAMGIVMGMALLGMMLMGMTYQKKRHDQHCQERYDKASRVAQIHRVSYRMGYGRVPVKEEDEEEKAGLL